MKFLALLALTLILFAGPGLARADEGAALRDNSFVRPAAPPIRIAAPVAGKIRRPPERVTVYFQRYEQALVGSSVELWIDGIEHTESLRFWIDRAWLELPAGFWAPGAHRILARVRSASGQTIQDDLVFELSTRNESDYVWPFDYDAPNVVANLMEDYQRFALLPRPPPAPYWHHGLDIRAPSGTSVRPVIGGYIAYKGCYSDCVSSQWNVTVLGDDDLLWQYSHLNHIGWTSKQVGDRVEPDEDLLGAIVSWPYQTNGAAYHHLHINAVELQDFDIASWRAMAEDPEATPPPVPPPLSANFKWHNPLEFLTTAGDLDTTSPEFDGEIQAGSPDILFLENDTEDAFNPMNTLVSGDVDIATRMRDTRDVIQNGLVPGQPFSLGLYEIAYSVVPIDTECFKGWIPRTPLAKFDVVPGEYDGDLQDQLLLDVFQRVIHLGGATYTTNFEYSQRNFWYNLTNSRWGILDGAAGYWNTDGATVQGPLFLDGTYRVTVYGADFLGNEISESIEVEVDNNLPANGGYCPTRITHFTLPGMELEPEGDDVLRFFPPPIPIAFNEIIEGSSRTSIPAAGWPAWYFDDAAQGRRYAIGVLDGDAVDVEYVPYIGDVIIEVPAELQLLAKSATFNPHAPSTRPLSLRISTRLARDPLTGQALLGSPHGLDQVAFGLVLAEPIEILGVPHRLRAVPASGASWTLEPTGDPGTPPVPDGTIGAPLRVQKGDPAATRLNLDWDANTCTGSGYNLIYGDLGSVRSLEVDGSACDLGTSGHAIWGGVPPGNLWFVVVSENGAGTEGSWGLDGTGAQRGGSTPSAECGNTARSNADSCP